MAIPVSTNGLVGPISTEAEISYQSDTTWTLRVSGGDVAIQRWMDGKDAKVDVYNGPVLDGEEVDIKTRSTTHLLYMTPTTGATYINFTRKYPEATS
jgi:hypothetical protein